MVVGRFQHVIQISVGLLLVCLVAFAAIAFIEFWVAPDVILTLDSFQWMGLSMWTLVFVSAIAFLMLFWLTIAFSLLALISAICVGAALTMIFSGFSLVWPILLLLLAAWGVSRASQFD